MDPKKAATVTSQELLDAFTEGSGGAGKAPADTSGLKVYLTLLTKNEGEAPEYTEYPLADLDKAIEELKQHLLAGGSRGAAIVIDRQPPLVVSDPRD